VLTSKGCPYQCSFCSLGKAPFSFREIPDVISELKECVHRYRVKEIDFFEALFTFNKQRTIELCRQIIKHRLRFDWACRSRVDTVDDETLKWMSRAGCKRVYYGIESWSSSVLSNVVKQITPAQTEKTVKLTHRHKLKALGFFMVGNPGDTPRTVRQSLEFAKRLGLDYIQVGRTVPKPFSQLHLNMIKETGRDFWRDYILYKIPEQRAPTPWTRLTHRQQEELARMFYKGFYYRPGYVLKRLLQTRSVDELWRYAKAAFDVLFSRYRDYQ